MVARKNSVVSYLFGQPLLIGDLADIAGVSYGTMETRIKRGMDPREAIAKPTWATVGDPVGQVFGELTMLGVAPSKTSAGKTRWLCRCACGSEKELTAGDIKSGRVKSCGCRLKKASSARSIARAEDLTGNLYANGNVRVIGYGVAMGNRRTWRCLCGCGQEFDAMASSLKNGAITSCGCGSVRRKRAKTTRLKKYELFGKTCTIHDLAEISGVAGPTLAHRIRNMGMSPEDAIKYVSGRTRVQSKLKSQ
jgi:hypothetical protein